jgi:outer membrane protein assembly factor BamB
VTFGVTLSSCGGGSSRTVPPMPGTTASPTTQSVLIRIAVPAAAATQQRSAQQERTVQYVSAGQQSMRVDVYAMPYTGQLLERVIQNMTAGSANCSKDASGSRSCTIPLNLAPGNYVANVASYAGLNAHGTVLSLQYNVFFSVPSNGNGNPTVIPWTLYGVPEKITLVPLTTSAVRSTGAAQVTLYSSTAVKYALQAFDADNQQIIGAGAPTWTVSSSNSSFTVAPPSTSSPGTLVVKPPADTAPATTQLQINAVFPDDMTRTMSSPCQQPKSVCTLAATIDYLNVFADDWTTFAHDVTRQGQETLSTGITSTTAPKLALRWKITVPPGSGAYAQQIYASPVVYAGNVIVVTRDPAVVYDYSAIDGTLLWSRALGSESVKTPTIDPVNQYVLVGNRDFNSTTGNSLPSTYEALRLVDGSVAWSTTVNGLTRSPEAIVNGTIFVGTAGGGDSQTSGTGYCANNGVTALDAATGSARWTWYVDQTTNPGGGGTVWGAIAYDGSRLIVPTGNTCPGETPVPTANGVVALDLNGNLLWNITAWSNAGADYDVGSGVMVAGGRATFLSKSGTMYSVTSQNGSIVNKITANANVGEGFFASPTTDGNTVVVSTGAYPDSSGTSARAATAAVGPDRCYTGFARRRTQGITGFHSLLEGFDSSGNVLWSTQMFNQMKGYAAIDDGLVFAGLDSTLVALNITNGGQVWSYATADTLIASPVVVPSGVYAADASGNVYAFSIPYATAPTAAHAMSARAVR